MSQKRRFTPVGRSHVTSSAPKLFTAEKSSLPTISIMSGSTWAAVPTFTAYVTAYAVTEDSHLLAGYKEAHLLGYLSMVSAPGHGNVLQAIYAALCTNSYKRVVLEGVGDVALLTKGLRLYQAGYSTHYNYDQQPVSLPGGAKANHGILEPKVLTYANPQKALAMARPRRGKGEDATTETTATSKGKKGVAKDKAVSLSTAGSATDTLQMVQSQEERPFFLMLIPGLEDERERERETYTAQLYRSFLNGRLPWPIKQEWATPLWEQAMGGSESGDEVMPMKVWSYPSPRDDKAEPPVATTTEQEDHSIESDLLPMLSGAYLCKPSATRIAQSIKQLVTTGHTVRSEVLPFRPAREEERVVVNDNDEREREEVYA